MNNNQQQEQKLLDEATVFRNNGQEEKAIAKYKEALLLFEDRKDIKNMAQTLQMIGVCYKIKNDTKKAITELQKAAELFKQIGDDVGLGNTYRDIGLTYLYKKDYSSALIWVSKSEVILKKTDSLVALGTTQIKIGKVFLMLERTQQARTYITKGLRNIRKEGSWFNEMTGFLHMAEIQFVKERYDEMMISIWSCLGLIFEARAEKEQERRLSQIYGLLAWGYLKFGNNQLAKEYLAKSKKYLSNMPEDVRKVIEEDAKLTLLQKELK